MVCRWVAHLSLGGRWDVAILKVSSLGCHWPFFQLCIEDLTSVWWFHMFDYTLGFGWPLYLQYYASPCSPEIDSTSTPFKTRISDKCQCCQCCHCCQCCLLSQLIHIWPKAQLGSPAAWDPGSFGLRRCFLNTGRSCRAAELRQRKWMKMVQKHYDFIAWMLL